MSDTFITVVAIILAAVLVFVVPLVVTSQRVDDVSQLDVETLTSNFVDEIRLTGKLTRDDYDKFLENLTATGNTYDINMEFKILDENPGKKSVQTTRDKIGENVYYSIYTTQIEDVLEDESKNNTYNLKQGDMVTVTVRNTNLTIGQRFKDFVYKVKGDDTYTISDTKSALVAANGSTEIVLNNQDNQDKITYTLRENDANGKKLSVNSWTNKNIYVEFAPEDNYNLNLIYYWRNYKGTGDYDLENDNRLDGNSAVFTERQEIEAYWKSSSLEKYSNIEKIKINIDRIPPTITNVTLSKVNNNQATVTVTANDEGGSGIASYYYKWTDGTKPEDPTVNTDGWTSNNTTIANANHNGKTCWVWVKDNAGNISKEPGNIKVENLIAKVADFKLSNVILKKDQNITIKPQNIVTDPIDSEFEYKEISYKSSDESVAQVDSNGAVKSLNPGTTIITCSITNYDDSVVTKEAVVTVVDVSYSPNGGNFALPYNNNEPGTSNIESNVEIKGASKAEYVWSNQNSSEPNTWTSYEKVTGGTVSKNSTKALKYYLWTKVSDQYGNYVIYVSNAFSIIASKITITPSTTGWTNKDITCTITYPNTTISNTRKAAFGNSIQSAKNNSNSANAPTTTVKVGANGYVYASARDSAGNQITASLLISNIDKVKPTIGSVSGTTIVSGNWGTITVSGVKDNGGSGLYAYYISQSPVAPSIKTSGWVKNTSSYFTRSVNAGGTYYIWVRDRAGNISGPRNCTVTAKIAVAKVGNTYYSSLQDAVNAISSYGTVVMVSDTTIYNNVEIHNWKNITLNLNGKTIRGTRINILVNKGQLSVTGSGTIEAINGTTIYNQGILNIYSGTLSGEGGWAVSNDGICYMRGGTVQYKSIDDGSAFMNRKTFYMYGGLITTNANGLVTRRNASHSEVTGGTIRCTAIGKNAILVDNYDNDGNGNIKIVNARIEALNGGAVAIDNETSSYDNCQVYSRQPNYNISGSVRGKVLATTNLSQGANEENITLYNTGYGSLRWYVWTINGDQDDMTVQTTYNLNGTHNYTVKKSDHNNETGEYQVHIYPDLENNFFYGLGLKF